jgi:hypothetical protein
LRENVSTYAGLGNPPHSETALMNMHNSALRSAARPVSAMMIAMMQLKGWTFLGLRAWRSKSVA